MKTKFKNGRRSIIPLHMKQRESASRFCVFPKVESENYNPCHAPVYLNIYDLTPLNAYFYWAGIGVFHSGLEGRLKLSVKEAFSRSQKAQLYIHYYDSFTVHGVEYAFGALDHPTSGIFEVEPGHCPGFRFRKSIYMGTTYLNPYQVREFLKYQSRNYYGDTYHLIVKNCNHFSNDICYKLTRNRIPKWVNRLARIGSLCNCILPGSLKTTTLHHNAGNNQDSEWEKTSLRRGSVNCISSIPMHQTEREVSISSMFLHSHYKDCLPPLDLKKETLSSKFSEE